MNIPYEYHSKLIAVTNRHLLDENVSLAQQIEKIGHISPRAIIVREKDMHESEYEALAGEILQICNNAKVPCILHSFPDAAIHLGCRRIHLPLNQLTAIAGNNYKTPEGYDIREYFEEIGTSTHSVQDIINAENNGATYVTAGHIYATDCKKDLAPRGLDFLREICIAATIPVYAIGGIHFDKDQIDEILSCGAAGGCIMSGFMRM